MRAAVIVSLLLLAGCASERYLSEQEDAEMRETCAAEGCVILPTPLWERLRRHLGIEGA